MDPMSLLSTVSSVFGSGSDSNVLGAKSKQTQTTVSSTTTVSPTLNGGAMTVSGSTGASPWLYVGLAILALVVLRGEL
jgi:hypothetical protein